MIILSSIFNKPINIYSNNVSEFKTYFDEYKRIKHNYKIPYYMLEYIENDTEFKIYCTQKSQEQYINFWKQRTKNVKYENIPDDFNPKEYKELNEDLHYMTDLAAKTHYEFEGYKENRKCKYENIPEDFNPKEYKELNEDLHYMTDLGAKHITNMKVT